MRFASTVIVLPETTSFKACNVIKLASSGVNAAQASVLAQYDYLNDLLPQLQLEDLQIKNGLSNAFLPSLGWCTRGL